MGSTQQQQAYAQSVGTAPTGFPWLDTRDPTTNDVNFKLGQFWINQQDIRLWYLNKLSNASGVLQATWELISTSSVLVSLSDTANTPVFPTSPSASPNPDNIQFVGDSSITITAVPGSNQITFHATGGAETLTGDDGVAVSPSGGTIQTLGNVVANGTHSKALYTTNSSGNIERFDIQISAAIAAGNVANVGLAAFSSAQFAVDTITGFVTLKGGSGAPTLGLTPDAHTAPGTTPVVPNGSGNIVLEGGATFATGTQANPIRTNSLAANTIDLQIQLAGANAAVSTANNFGVAQFDSNSFGVSSGFVTLNNAGTTGAVTKLLGDDGGANTVVPSSGVITLDGVTCANATNSKPVFFKKNATSIEELDVQLATTSTSGTKNINKSGLSHFDSTYFTIDSATGFVSLSATPNLGLIPDAHTAPGTSPVVPNGSGNITIEGGVTFATGTQANPIRTNSLAANTIDLQIQLAGSNAATSTANNFGVSQFDSNQFAVVSGFVQLKGGGTAPALTKIAVDAVSSGTNPTVPDSSGQITLTGAQVATGTVGANVVRSVGTSANTVTLQIQRSTSSAASDSTKNGVCHFDSSKFGVDSNGFVTFTGTTGNLPWTDESSPFSAASNNGYFCTAALTATLPATPAQGDIIRIVCDTSGAVVVQANTGQKIRIANTINSGTAGTATSTKQGDSLDLVYRSSSSTWYAFSSPCGVWGLS